MLIDRKQQHYQFSLNTFDISMMDRFRRLFKHPFCNVIGMIHLRALPGNSLLYEIRIRKQIILYLLTMFNNTYVGTPKSSLSIDAIRDIACQEGELYLRQNLVPNDVSKS